MVLVLRLEGVMVIGVFIKVTMRRSWQFVEGDR